MDLVIKSKIVSTYKWIIIKDGSMDGAGLDIYVDKAWYQVKFDVKDNFINKISALKKIATGYSNLNIKDAYTGETIN